MRGSLSRILALALAALMTLTLVSPGLASPGPTTTVPPGPAATAEDRLEFGPPLFRLGARTASADSIAVSRLWKRSKYVVIVSDRNKHEQLIAASLAGLYRAPLLVTSPRGLSKSMIARIRQLRPTYAFVVGPSRSLGAGVVRGLLKARLKPRRIRRLGGKNVLVTARLVGRQMKGKRRSAYGVIVANASRVDLAYGMAGVGGYAGWPVLLTSKKRLPAETVRTLKALRPERIVFTGTASVIPTSQATKALSIAKLPWTQFTRLAEKDRYKAAVATAEYAFANGFSYDFIIVANGDSPSAAAMGAALSSRWSNPLVLTRSRSVPTATQEFFKDHCSAMDLILLIGSTRRISVPVARRLERLAATVCSPDLRVLSPESASTLVSVAPDGSSLTFQPGDPYVAQIRPGEVLVSGPCTAAPEGFMYRVQGVSVASQGRGAQGLINIRISEATLAEVFSKCSIDIATKKMPAAPAPDYYSKTSLAVLDAKAVDPSNVDATFFHPTVASSFGTVLGYSLDSGRAMAPAFHSAAAQAEPAGDLELADVLREMATLDPSLPGNVSAQGWLSDAWKSAKKTVTKVAQKCGQAAKAVATTVVKKLEKPVKWCQKKWGQFTKWLSNWNINQKKKLFEKTWKWLGNEAKSGSGYGSANANMHLCGVSVRVDVVLGLKIADARLELFRLQFDFNQRAWLGLDGAAGARWGNRWNLGPEWKLGDINFAIGPVPVVITFTAQPYFIVNLDAGSGISAGAEQTFAFTTGVRWRRGHEWDCPSYGSGAVNVKPVVLNGTASARAGIGLQVWIKLYKVAGFYVGPEAYVQANSTLASLGPPRAASRVQVADHRRVAEGPVTQAGPRLTYELSAGVMGRFGAGLKFNLFGLKDIDWSKELGTFNIYKKVFAQGALDIPNPFAPQKVKPVPSTVSSNAFRIDGLNLSGATLQPDGHTVRLAVSPGQARKAQYLLSLNRGVLKGEGGYSAIDSSQWFEGFRGPMIERVIQVGKSALDVYFDTGSGLVHDANDQAPDARKIQKEDFSIPGLSVESAVLDDVLRNVVRLGTSDIEKGRSYTLTIPAGRISDDVWPNAETSTSFTGAWSVAIVGASATSSRTVEVVFDAPAPLDASSVQPTDFQIRGTPLSSDLTVTAASVFGADGKAVRLTTSPQTKGADYSVLVSDRSLSAGGQFCVPSSKAFKGYWPITISSASAATSKTVNVFFDAPGLLDPSTVQPSDFSIPGLSVTAASPSSVDKLVTLSTSTQTKGTNYTVSVAAGALRVGTQPCEASSRSFIGHWPITLTSASPGATRTSVILAFDSRAPLDATRVRASDFQLSGLTVLGASKTADRTVTLTTSWQGGGWYDLNISPGALYDGQFYNPPIAGSFYVRPAGPG